MGNAATSYSCCNSARGQDFAKCALCGGPGLYDAPEDEPKQKGLVDNCFVCLPEACCRQLHLKPNINDKGHEKKLWLGRVWQLRLHIRRTTAKMKDTSAKNPWGAPKEEELSEAEKRKLAEDLKDPRRKNLLISMQKRWRGAVIRNKGSLHFLSILSRDPASHFNTVLFMHGSGGLTWNNVRYVRNLAQMGCLVIAPDSMAGGRYRSRESARPINAADKTPYWDDLGLYSTGSEGEYAYSTSCDALLGNPEQWRRLYTNVYRMRRNEMHWVLSHMPEYMKRRGIIIMGQSEGAMTVARFDDQKYGAMIRGRIISAFSVEYCYFTPEPEAGTFGGNLDVPTLNIIGDADEFFGPGDSVAANCIAHKDEGGWGASDFTGNAFKEMKKRKILRGLVAVLEGGKHDASNSHDNFIRDLLASFINQPGHCQLIPDLWSRCAYLSSKVQVLERDNEGRGERVLMKVGAMDFPVTLPHWEELVLREVAVFNNAHKQLLSDAKDMEEKYAVGRRSIGQWDALVHELRDSPPSAVETMLDVYASPEMPKKEKKGSTA